MINGFICWELLLFFCIKNACCCTSNVLFICRFECPRVLLSSKVLSVQITRIFKPLGESLGQSLI